jgi:hypothetical protein
MRRYDHLEIERALRALDSVCTGPEQIVVIGGAAIALHTRAPSGTQDIDHLPPSLDDLLARCAAANIELPPINASAVSDVPWNSEDRLQRVLPDLLRLEVLLLEPHDLALSKVVRWQAGDEEDVVELHGARPLSSRILIDRYLCEMTHVIGDPRRIELNFVECVERLFGEITGEQARDAVRARLRRKQV